MKCYFFGTFNPVHIGHIKIANAVKKEFNFERVIFVPSPKSPYKDGRYEIHRLTMLKLAAGEDNVSDIEYNMERPSYTYKTVEKLGKCYFITGYDTFLDIDNWKHPEILKETLTFIVIPRSVNCSDKEFENLRLKGYNFKIAKFEPCDISSSEIRAKIQKGESIRRLVPKKVEEYIYEHGLYKELA